MEVQNNENKTTTSIIKKLERYLSINRHTKTKKILSKSMSWHSSTSKASKSINEKAPNGCFYVYVGVERQRFVIKTEFANHPLFKMLLEDAKLEYGFRSEGPLLVPCEVDLFGRVLAEIIDSGKDQFDQYYRCRFGYGSCSPFSCGRRHLGRSPMAKGNGSYGLLTPSSLLEINHF